MSVTSAPRHSLSEVDLEADPPTAVCSVCGPTGVKVRRRKTGYVEKTCRTKYRADLDKQPSTKASRLKYAKLKKWHKVLEIDFLARTATCAVCGPGAPVRVFRPWDKKDKLEARCAAAVEESALRQHAAGPCQAPGCAYASPHACAFLVIYRDRDPSNTHPDNMAVFCRGCAATFECALGMKPHASGCPEPRMVPLSSWARAQVKF